MENEIMIQSIVTPLGGEEIQKKDRQLVKSNGISIKKPGRSFFYKLLDLLSIVDWEYYCRIK